MFVVMVMRRHGGDIGRAARRSNRGGGAPSALGELRLVERGKQLLQLAHLGHVPGDDVGVPGVRGHEILMLGLGRIEPAEGGHLGEHAPFELRRQAVPGFLGQAFLIVAVVKDDRLVLRGPGPARRIVLAPKVLKQSFETDALGNG